jgi:hypothetical protein
MREVWIRAALPDPLAAALEGGAIAMVVVLKPGEGEEAAGKGVVQ